MIHRETASKTATANVQTLADDCQQLARQMRFFALGGVKADPVLLETLSALLERANGVFQDLSRGGSSPAGFASAPPERALALRMLQSGGPEMTDPGLHFKSDDRPPSSRHIQVLRGSECIFHAPDLISFLGEQLKTGVLEIRTRGEVFMLELENGQIAHLQSNQNAKGERLGDILVDMGVIGRAQLEEAYKRNPRGRLGELLLTGGLVNEQQLFDALQRQIHLLFQRLTNEPMERFVFWQGPLILAQERLRLNATALLLECARVKDEQDAGERNPGT